MWGTRQVSLGLGCDHNVDEDVHADVATLFASLHRAHPAPPRSDRLVSLPGYQSPGLSTCRQVSQDMLQHQSLNVRLSFRLDPLWVADHSHRPSSMPESGQLQMDRRAEILPPYVTLWASGGVGPVIVSPSVQTHADIDRRALCAPSTPVLAVVSSTRSWCTVTVGRPMSSTGISRYHKLLASRRQLSRRSNVQTWWSSGGAEDGEPLLTHRCLHASTRPLLHQPDAFGHFRLLATHRSLYQVSFVCVCALPYLINCFQLPRRLAPTHHHQHQQLHSHQSAWTSSTDRHGRHHALHTLIFTLLLLLLLSLFSKLTSFVVVLPSILIRLCCLQ